LEYAIEAVARLGPGSRARLVVAGDGPERKKLQETAARANLGRRVTFLGGRADVAGLLGAADGYICASRQEGHPLALLEAMSASLPVVAPRLTGIEEVGLPGNPAFYGEAGPMCTTRP